MTYYLAVQWHHEFDDEPIEMISEVTDAGVETRKIERYRDGRVDIADSTRATGSTLLSESLMPTIAEINDQSEFTAAEISYDVFESLWAVATRNR